MVPPATPSTTSTSTATMDSSRRCGMGWVSLSRSYLRRRRRRVWRRGRKRSKRWRRCRWRLRGMRMIANTSLRLRRRSPSKGSPPSYSGLEVI
ncbi:hypothetical protein SAICODRAFT_140392 [Saitoella complicata NRRL Y-17804]|uniref:uncharacterized protein n=1 Tax=Saitoella complicata (strain BCRC 22490 / CBS 7301 / JCM 7358 / NBRC 10748 / NRRL Y-17804) TaxID=698492 RepID=UPI000867A949|nr:uncharacterized protein SAICODRAFT_140392 [Saitoella complicata NRRL Y-17804]ODQ51943.1 hypothetical protein SAICODRAFT_140392 [Saitoella complicata NRRL Y-17804]